MVLEDLGELSRAELARRLAGCRRYSNEWNRLRAECLRRAARWDRVAGWCLWVLLGFLLLVQLLVLASDAGWR